MKLYTYWRSSASYRIRLALAIKGLSYESEAVHLLRDGGEQLKMDYTAINPQKLVPTLILDDGIILTQSMAILEYLEEAFPEPALLPEEPTDRAYIRGLCQTIVSDIHPLGNLRVLTYLKGDLKVEEDQKMIWYKHWIKLGFEAIEKTLSQSKNLGRFCFEDTPSFADICLVPQVYNAQRFGMNLLEFPNIQRINDNCQKLDSFIAARPENQADAVI